ncbi:MAG TPA: PmoA family protein [Flavisolibacter sp.]|nr:PmoA family protein [Flavisolibacter sp.]
MRSLKKYIVLLISTSFFLNAVAQPIATLEVRVPQDNTGLSIPVQVALDAVTMLPDSVLQLVEITGGRKAPVASQVYGSEQRTLHWILTPQAVSGKRIFELIKKPALQKGSLVTATAADSYLTIAASGKNLLRYNYKTVYPPAGVDTVYKRSGFIHPLWSPRGQELTRINAPDHYHHWGLWNPWTQVLFERDTIDFWNLVKKEGTVRFADFLSTTNGAVFAGFKALHQHIVFKKNGEEKIALNEVQSVRIYNPEGAQNYYIADITITLACATKSPVLLLEYRYGGLGLRATAEWNKDNSYTITSEGKTRKDADGSTAKWCMVQGAIDGDSAGLVMMSYPTNYNHPEPLRVWPENMNGRGDVFINFSPTKNTNWLISPGKEYVLKYRLLLFNDSFSKQQAEKAWQNFAYVPTVTVTKEHNNNK